MELFRYGMFLTACLLISFVAQSVGLVVGAAMNVQNGIYKFFSRFQSIFKLIFYIFKVFSLLQSCQYRSCCFRAFSFRSMLFLSIYGGSLTCRTFDTDSKLLLWPHTVLNVKSFNVSKFTVTLKALIQLSENWICWSPTSNLISLLLL
jgi:hypothetical protein